MFSQLTDRTDSIIFLRSQHVASIAPRSGGGTKIGMVGGQIVEVQQTADEVLRVLRASLGDEGPVASIPRQAEPEEETPATEAAAES